MSTTITFRTDEELKKQATAVYESLGMNLSTALNLFMRQTVLQQRFPCALDLALSDSIAITYKQGFFDLFGKGNSLGFDEEPEDIPVAIEELSL